MRKLGSRILLVAAVLVFASPAAAETVARGVHEGMLALARGAPSVAFVRGNGLFVATRVGRGEWRRAKVVSVSHGTRVVGFAVGRDGPVVLTLNKNATSLGCFRQTGSRWQHIKLGRKLPASRAYGLPGLTFDPRNRLVVAYSRWSSATLDSQLLLARIDTNGRPRVVKVTSEGFPQSFVPPPAAPVVVKGKIHVIESYGYRTAQGTIEWYPKGPTWEGVFLEAGRGEFPLGSVFAAATPAGRMFAAWSQSILGFNAAPVTLAVGGPVPRAKFLVDRGLTTGLALVARRPEVAANEWVSDDPNDIFGTHPVWAAEVLKGGGGTELDGRIAGYAADGKGRRNLLLNVGRGLSWFRARALATHVTIQADPRSDGSVVVTGRVRGVQAGKVSLYREPFGATRTLIATPTLSSGTFAFVDRAPVLPSVYRAVYRDPKTGIPYAALLRSPLS